MARRVDDFDYLRDANDSRPFGGCGLSPAARVLLALFILLFVGAIGVGAATVLPFRVASDSIQAVSGAWEWILSFAPWRSTPLAQPSPAEHIGRTPVIEAPAGSGDGGGTVEYGDQLKITFFETTGVQLESDEKTPSDLVSVVFPRMDLSGNYTIDESGGLHIPKLGRVAAAGKAIGGLQVDLAAAFERAMGRKSDVYVAVADRLPVYVAGAVRGAGSLKYVPGMIVIQALAGAGGIDRSSADISRAIEDIRESGRLRLAKDNLDGLLVKEARLLAQKTNSERLTVPASISSRLAQAGPHDRLRKLIAMTHASLEAEHKHYREQQLHSERQVEVAKFELETQKVRIERLGDLLTKNERKLQELRGFAQRGSVPHQRIMDMEIELSERMARRDDYRVAFAETKRRVVEAEAAQAKLRRDHNFGIEAELSATQQEIHKLVHEIQTMQGVIQALQDGMGETLGAGRVQQLSITRRVAGQFVVIPAADTTALLPGDVLKVDLVSRSGVAFDDNAQHTTR